MTTTLRQTDLEALELEWLPGGVFVRGGGEPLRVLREVLDMAGPTYLGVVAVALQTRTGTSFNDWGFRFPGDEAAWGGEPVDHVEVFDPFDEESQVEPEAFVGLLRRWLAFWVAEAEAHSAEVTKRPEWQQIRATAGVD